MDFHQVMEGIVYIFEAAGVAIFALGSLAAVVRGAASWSRGARATVYRQVRRDIGLSILLGLEVLIIADIIETITIDLSLESALILAIIVLVRTLLSFSLEVELEGAFPWRLAALRRSRGVASEGPL
jgi:uncharacterized membrane protein